MRVCLDVNGQVAFFTSKGRAIFDAPPPKLGKEAEGLRGGSKEGTDGSEPVGTAGDLGPNATLQHQPFPEPHVPPMAGAAHWTRDHHIPWTIEAQAWEALDTG
jgi:hypothetical protein